MSVLAIDTSSRQRVVVVLATRDGAPERSVVRTGAAVGAALPTALAGLLDGAVVGAVVVAVGPGSYTGLRAGMASALGVAQGRGVELHGVGSLEVVAAGWPSGEVDEGIVATDASRGFAYAARYHRRGEQWSSEQPRRVAMDSAELRDCVVASSDDLPVSQLVRIEPALALAAVVPRALASPPLRQRGLAAVYVE